MAQINKHPHLELMHKRGSEIRLDYLRQFLQSRDLHWEGKGLRAIANKLF